MGDYCLQEENEMENLCISNLFRCRQVESYLESSLQVVLPF